ncbi:MAG: hypothetical protein ACO1QS_14655, partial [Verrucomicrobiota bacterium]
MKTTVLKPNRPLGGIFALAIFAVVTAGLAQPAPRPAAPPNPKQLEGLYRLLDVNRDNKLSRTEFSKMEQYSPRLKGNPDAVDYLFVQLDKNGDDQLVMT